MERAEAETIYDAGREVCVAFILDLTTRYEKLEGRVARLEEQLRQSSRNSSAPPSSDPPTTRQQRREKGRQKATRTDRTQGAQPGHPGAGRTLAPPDKLDEIVDHYPTRCRGCGHEFTDAERTPSHRPGRRQVAELPKITVLLTEHRAHRLGCPHCRARTRAQLPEQVHTSAFGPRLQAAVVTLSARNRVSRRDMSELGGELFGTTLSVGAVDAICQRTAGALEEPHARLVSAVLDHGAVNVDETGWCRAGEGRTMWTAATPIAAIFRIATDRHRDRLEELLGESFAGIVCSDRWWAYAHLDPERRQACWEHIKRDFRRHAEGHAEQKLFGEAGAALTGRLFEVWRAFAEHKDRRRLRREMTPVQTELRTLLEDAGRKSTRTRFHRVFANNLLKIWPALWTFVTVTGVEPTNNAAERALRGPVIHRKLSYGSQSEEGERFIERALSASVSCRLQGRSLFTYLAELIAAHARGDPLPALA